MTTITRRPHPLPKQKQLKRHQHQHKKLSLILRKLQENHEIFVVYQKFRCEIRSAVLKDQQTEQYSCNPGLVKVSTNWPNYSEAEELEHHFDLAEVTKAPRRAEFAPETEDWSFKQLSQKTLAENYLYGLNHLESLLVTLSSQMTFKALITI